MANIHLLKCSFFALNFQREVVDVAVDVVVAAAVEDVEEEIKHAEVVGKMRAKSIDRWTKFCCVPDAYYRRKHISTQ